MSSDIISGYIGCFQQPLQKPEAYCPTMYLLSDGLKTEVNLIMLTPGALLHAYKYLNAFNAQCIKLFVPSLRYEFISDIFNLYRMENHIHPTKWIFPDSIDHTSFSDGEIRMNNYINEFDTNITISYLTNENVDGVYDIIVRDADSCNYFCQYLTEELATTLYENEDITQIHIPYNSTLYGGLTFLDVLNINKLYRTKFVPHSFSSIEEYNSYLENGKLEKGKVVYNDFI